MASERQIEANRLNAQKSTGPRTEEGKSASRGNALKHGLSGAGVVLEAEEAALVDEREQEWYSSHKPCNAFEVSLARMVALESVRADRCEREERALRARLAERAAVCWDADQRLAAEKLGAGLRKHPAVVRRELELTPQGCGWLLERWEALERAWSAPGTSTGTGAQRTLALDLLGTPEELRDLPTKLDPAPGGDERATGLAVARAEVARLVDWKTRLEPIDAREHEAAARGEATEPHRALVLLRRYEGACERRKAWALKQFKNGRHAYSSAATTCGSVGDSWSSTAYRQASAPSPPPRYRYEAEAEELLRSPAPAETPRVDPAAPTPPSGPNEVGDRGREDEPPVPA